MKDLKLAQELLASLAKGGLNASCPHCNETFPLSRASLFVDDHFSEEARELFDQKRAELAARRADLRRLPDKISEDSDRGAGAVNLGGILERLAPTLPSFPFTPSDCRSLFDPIDYAVFVGSAAKGKVDRIVFAELKSGGARLTSRQAAIRDIVSKGRVEFATYDPKEAM